VAAVAASSVYSSGAEMSGHQEARSAYRWCSAALLITAIILAHPGPATPRHLASRAARPHPLPGPLAASLPRPLARIPHPGRSPLLVLAPARRTMAARRGPRRPPSAPTGLSAPRPGARRWPGAGLTGRQAPRPGWTSYSCPLPPPPTPPA